MTEGANVDHPFRSGQGRWTTYRSLVVAAYAAGCGTVAAALAIALLRHAPKPAASAVAREVRA